MKLTKNYAKLTSIGLMLCFALTGCGNGKNSTSGNNNTTKNNLAEDATNSAEDVADGAGDAVKDIADGAGNVLEDVANGAENVVKDAGDGVGDAVKDAGDGVGDAVKDLVGTNGFANYNEAQNYFLNSMSSYHADATFELRDTDRELNDYQEGSKGYHFHLYDTSKNKAGELFGEFFVDANSGQIYQKNKDGKIIEYPNNVQANRSR